MRSPLKFYLINLAAFGIKFYRVTVVVSRNIFSAAGNGNTASNDTAGISAKGKNRRGNSLAVFPLKVNLEAAAGNNAPNVTLFPLLGGGREEVYLTAVALDKSLGNSRASAEVSVYLERRVHIEHINAR